MISDELKTKVKEQIGYINVFRRGVFDVLDEANEDAPPGWRVTYTGWHARDIPDGAVRVGQVRVHHGDPEFRLYAIPHWLEVAGAIEFYGVKKSSLTRALRRGEIARAKKRSGKWRFPLLSLLEWDGQQLRRER